MLNDKITKLCCSRFQLLRHFLRDNKKEQNAGHPGIFRAVLLLAACFIKWKGQREVRQFGPAHEKQGRNHQESGGEGHLGS